MSAACTEPDVTPATLTKQSDFAAGPVVGASSTVSLIVANKSGKALEGIPVVFAVAGGGGSITTPATDTTDATGLASATVTLGTIVGANSVTATVVGLPALTFSATTIAGPAASIQLPSAVTVVAVSGTANLTATAKDSYGNAATLPTVTWTSRAAAATVSSSGAVSGVSAGQAMIVATTSAGSDSTLAIVAQAGGPVIMPDLTSFALNAGADKAINVILDMRDSQEKVGSSVVKLEWDPTVMTYQSHTADAAGPTAIVNATTATSGTLALSFADATGFSGKVTLLKLVFKAGTAGKTGTLKLSTTEVTAATSFTNLTSKTVATSMPIVVR